jgi:hypothetical protein
MHRYLVNKDLIQRKIDAIDDSAEDALLANLHDGKKHLHLIVPFVEDLDAALGRMKGYEPCSLVVYNARQNIEAVIKNWEKLVRFKRHFSIHFVNPFSKTDKRWTIFPSTHHLVTDKAGLRPGLEALFMTVEPITKEEVERIIATG